MHRPVAVDAAPARRLLLATTAAVLCQLVLSWLASVGLANDALTLGSLSIVDGAVVLVAMAVGGWIGGMRFLPIAMLLAAVVWIASIFTLAYAGLPVSDAPLAQNLLRGLRFNGLAIGASIVFAAIGCILGALLGRRLHGPGTR